MIVDTSAIAAILLEEGDGDTFLESLLHTTRAAMSAASYLEAGIVIDKAHDPVLSRRLDELLEALRIEIVPITAEHARVARAAYRDFGKGSGHRAGLNFGDCFSYALAKVTAEPLLFKGNDFQHTDVKVAATGPTVD